MIILFIVGVLFATLGSFLWVDAYLFRTKARYIKGKVVAYETHQSQKNGAMYAPVITYQDQDSQYRFKSTISSNRMDYALQDTVDVLVLNNQHSGARLKRNDRLFLSLLFAFMGVVSILVGLSEIDVTYRSLSLAISLLVTVAGVYFLLQLSVNYRKRQEEKFTYTPGSDGVIGCSINENMVQDIAFVESKSVSKRMHILGIVIGIALLTGSLYWSYVLQQYIDSAVRIEGLIVDKERSYSDDTATYAAIVKFTPNNNTTPRTFTSKVNSSNPTWHVGDKVMVMYDPRNVDDAMIDRGFFNYIIQLVMALVGLIITLISLYQYRQKK